MIIPERSYRQTCLIRLCRNGFCMKSPFAIIKRMDQREAKRFQEEAERLQVEREDWIKMAMLKPA